MRFYLDGKAADPRETTVSQHGFGQPKQSANIAYCLEVAKQDFLSVFSPIYDACITELKRDDKITGKFTPPYPGATAYPSIDELLDLEPKSLLEFIHAYFSLDILRAYFVEDNVEEEVKWILRSLDSIRVKGDAIRIEGRASRMPQGPNTKGHGR
jgi:hypothetical protein